MINKIVDQLKRKLAVELWIPAGLDGDPREFADTIDTAGYSFPNRVTGTFVSKLKPAQINKVISDIQSSLLAAWWNELTIISFTENDTAKRLLSAADHGVFAPNALITTEGLRHLGDDDRHFVELFLPQTP